MTFVVKLLQNKGGFSLKEVIEMKVAAAYIRVSTEDQIEFSPDSQLKAIESYAKKNNYYLPEQYIFIDEGISGRNTKKRDGFNYMIGLAKSRPKPFDVILVWKYSRFARNREDSVVYKSMLRKQCEIDVVSISETIGDDKMSILFEAMIEAMDEYYSINLAEEVKRGMTEKAKRGGVLTTPSFGYKVENNNYIVIPEEAEIIKKVFNDYNNGKGFLTIAKTLNAMGVKTHRGNKIENRTVEYWLNNPIYVGKIRWNPTGKTSRDYQNKNLIITKGIHQPIVDDDLWNSVQQKLQERKAFYKKNMREPAKGMSCWLNGVLRCGVCGRVLGNCGGFYYCSGKSKGLCKGNGCISVGVMSNIVITELERILDCDDIQLKFDETKNKKNDDNFSELRFIKIKIEEVEKKLLRVREAYENGVDTIEEYKINKQKFLNEKLELEKLLLKEDLSTKTDSDDEDVQNTLKLKKELKKVSDILRSEDVSTEEKNRVLKSIIKEIVKTGNGRTFEFVFHNPST